MGVHDRPFPPAALPAAETRLFRMAYELAYRQAYAKKEPTEDGRGCISAVRKIGPFEIRVEHHVTVPDNLIRYWIWIWHEGALVFDAWCSMIASTGATTGHVQRCDDGEWKYHLRVRHQQEEKA